MDEILNNPAFQGGVAPFLVALVFAGVFVKARTLAAFSLVAGVVTAVMLTTGLQFSPLTSTRKIVLILLVIPFIGLLLDALQAELENKISLPLYALGIISITWILWPVISRNSLGSMLLPWLGYVIYVCWMIGIYLRMAEMPRLSAAAASTGLGFGVGFVALVGSSALLGQWGLAFGAAAAAYLLTLLFYRDDEPAGYTFSLISAFAGALLLPAAVVYANVSWLALPLMAIVPLLAFYPFDEANGLVKSVIGILFVMSIPIGIAVYLTMQVAGAPAF